MTRLLLVCVLLACGCSLLNAPDRSRIHDAEPTDADMDGDAPDADVPDGDEDGDVTDADDRDVPTILYEDCEELGDEDGNGTADCADFACTGLDACCSADEEDELFREEFMAAPEGWTVVPTDEGAAPVITSMSLASFESDKPNALRRRTCTPLALGARVSVSMEREENDCESCFTALVLTAAEDMARGSRLLADLAVEMNPHGRIRITQGGAEVTRSAVEYDDRADIVVEISPGTDSRGRAAMLGTVTVTTGLDDPTTLLERYPVVLTRDLLGSCGLGAPGLFVALEGQGTAARVTRVTASSRECANPSQFEALTTIGSGFLRLDDWSAGGFGAPSLVWSREGSDDRLDYFVEASREDRRTELFGAIEFAIGYHPEPQDGTFLTDPLVGCLDEGTACHDSYREPFAYGALTGSDSLASIALVVAKRESGDAYHLQAARLMPSGTFGALVDVPTDTDCDSMRDPALAPRSDRSEDGYLLFYTCISGTGPSTIRARLLDFNFEEDGAPKTVIDATLVGAFAEGGVRSPEVLAEPFFADGVDKMLYRVWFAGRDRGGATTAIGLAHGEAELTHIPDAFAPYPANPVLASNAPELTCGGVCSFEGFSVTRIREDVRFLVAQRVNIGGAISYELVPLSQTIPTR